MMHSPLAQSLERLTPDNGLLLLAAPPDDTGWIRTSELHGTDMLDGVLRTVHEHVRASVPTSLRDRVPTTVAPSYVLEWYLWAVFTAAALPFVHERRVPLLHPDTVAIQLADEGWPVAVALLSPTFICLSDDPDVDHPHARPVIGLDSLRAALRLQVADHAEGFLQAWGRRGRRGRRALWAAATDALVEAVQSAAPGGRGAREAAALLADCPDTSPAPFVGAATFTAVGRPGAPDEPFRQRASCCFAYAVPLAEACFACPRTTAAERVRRLAAHRVAG